MPHSAYLNEVQQRTHHLLDHYLPKATLTPERLHKAMRYSALNPGKRIRPALVYASGEMLGADYSVLDTPAIAIELVHAYSLIHDDLPCMDDDDLRRGIATCHIEFDEATAVLAGDALQTLAFEILAGAPDLELEAETRIKMLTLLARASGSLGMGGGQAIDLALTNRSAELATLESMHQMKTGALIDASVTLGYLAAQIHQPDVLRQLTAYSSRLGLAFQIRDDILDIEADTQTLGKPQGSDVDKNKLTFPALMGLKDAKCYARQLINEALEALAQIPYNSEQLANLARYVIQRDC